MDFLTLMIIYTIVFFSSTLLVFAGSKDSNIAVVRWLFIYGDKLSSFLWRSLVPHRIRRWLNNLSNRLLYQRNPVFQIIYCLLWLMVFLHFSLSVDPLLRKYHTSTGFVILAYAGFFINLILFLCCSWTNPGMITENNYKKFVKVYRYDDQMYAKDAKCMSCQIIKPARSKHCAICDHCVHRFDHHCSWINSCVGAGNVKYFLLFLWSVTLQCATVASLSTLAIWKVAKYTGLRDAHYMDANNVKRPVNIFIIVQHLFLKRPFVIFITSSLSLLVLLTGGFASYHLYLACTNQTTNERYKLAALRAAKRKKGWKNHGGEKAWTYSKGLWRNLQEVLLGIRNSDNHTMETSFPDDMLVTDLMTTMMPDASGPPHYVIVLKKVNKILLTSLLAFIMVGMGCVVTVNDFRVVVRRPIGAIIGFVCQFVILPLTAFILAHVLSLKPAFAIGMLITASSPGGVTSNLYTYWSDGDVCLSIVMTTVSTLAALVMLPFNLWLYSRSWTDNNGALIPYSNIIISLVLIIIPVAIGMVIRWKSEKVARIITMIGSISGLLAIGMNLIINGIINPGMFSSPWTLWLAAVLLPWCGYCLGFFFAWLLRQTTKQCRTISFETGAQNVGIALSLIAVTFDGSPLFYDLFTYPSIFAFALIIEALILVLIHRAYDKKYPEKKQDSDEEGNGEATPETDAARYTKKDPEESRNVTEK